MSTNVAAALETAQKKLSTIVASDDEVRTLAQEFDQHCADGLGWTDPSSWLTRDAILAAEEYRKSWELESKVA